MPGLAWLPLDWWGLRSSLSILQANKIFFGNQAAFL
jgi:hypothetical protein